MNYKESYIILFDGVCNLCNSMVNFTIRRDPSGKFKFAALQSDAGKILLKKYDLSENDFDTFVFISDGKYYVKSTAGLKVLKALGGIWKLTYIFIYFPKFLRDFIYDIIAKVRYRVFGKRNVCMIPSENIKERFL